jgi:RDD family protein
MRVVTWNADRVSTGDSVAFAGKLSGEALRDAYIDALSSLTLSLIRLRDNAIVFGPLTLLRFGEPVITKQAVDWPIEGGLLAGGPGGRWRLRASGGRVEASLTGYRPRLPRPLYMLTHLQVHQLFTRLYLLRLHGREPAPGMPARAEDRWRAAAVDVAFCLTIARMTGRRRLRRTLAIAAAYHVVCWSTSGRTLGGLVMRQRVVAVDGSRLSPTQALLRLSLLPLSWITRRPIHDEIAETEVISQQ